MKAICCIKQVYDLDMILEKDWVVDTNNNTVDIHYAKRIMNPFDEAALELMLLLQDSNQEMETECLTIGNQLSNDILVKSLAVGVQKATRVDVEHNTLSSPNEVATLLYNQIKDSNADLVLCGKQSDLHNHSQTPQILANKLDWRCFTNVFQIEKIDKNKFLLSRLSNNNIEKITVSKPIVVSVIQSENQYLRMATLRNMLLAKKTNINTISTDTALKHLENCHITYCTPMYKVERPQKECKYIQDNYYNELFKLINSTKEDVR